ncbi:DMT family transporter [Vibrio nigripulchritudo]|uniref:DMT family transporter n=1 Tax=Vibrio nigripulchritudo TaxID=28173 RepID=UPI0005FA29CF|nr:DMT family transporter [Vibrio nigripulchritudo]KJY75198.1 multidrug transporter [Vibrio nigripulchritudo]
MPTRWIPWIFVVLWASGFVGSKLGLEYTDPATLLTVRTGLNVLILSTLVVLLRRKALPARKAMHACISGLMIHGMYLGGTYVAIKLGMPASLSALLVGLQPILTAVVLVVVGTTVLRPLQWGGLILGLVGIFLVLHGKMEWVDDSNKLGSYAAIIIALLGITFGTLYQKKFCQGTDLVTCVTWQYLASLILFAGTAWVFEPLYIHWTPTFVATLTWLVVVLSVLAVLLLLYMVEHGESEKVASTFYLVPPVTAIQAWLLFDESFDLMGVVGFGCAALAVYLVASKGKPRVAASEVTAKSKCVS